MSKLLLLLLLLSSSFILIICSATGSLHGFAVPTQNVGTQHFVKAGTGCLSYVMHLQQLTSAHAGRLFVPAGSVGVLVKW
jgi:hypothetical protein